MASSITQSGGYDYEFVDTNLPDEFQCPICILVPRDVHQVSCCGKMFCKSCLDELKRISTNYTCPNCREDLTNNHFFKDINMNRKIRNLHIHCTNKYNGCYWNGSLQDINNHLSKCLYQIVECSNKCGEQLNRCYLRDHLTKKCPKRIVLCRHCKYKSQHRIIAGIHLTQCPNIPLHCPNNGCKQKIKRCLMTQHRAVCPHEMVMCSNRCDFLLKRHELDIHLHNTCPKRIVSCIYCEKEDEYQIINGDHYDKECPDYPLPCPNNGCENKIKRRLMTEHRDTCPKEEVVCQYSQVGCHEMMKREDTPYHNQEHIEEHLSKAVSMITELKCTTQQLKVPQHSDGGTFLTKMKGFEALKETNTSWSSPEFYTHPGYKFCLTVHPNGCKDCEGTHVSCYIKIIPGEYDDALEWPFQGEVTVELLNQLEDKQHHKTFMYFDQEDGERNFQECVIGYSNFIHHHELHSKIFLDSTQPKSIYIQYLKDDMLYFRVTVDVHSETKPWLVGAI